MPIWRCGVIRRFILPVLLLLPMLTACEEDAAGPDTSHVGVYQLQTVNGEEVPVSFEEDGGIFTIVEATATLNENETFTMTAELEITAGAVTVTDTDVFAGTYTRAGNTLTFDHDREDEGFNTATISGDVLTTTGGGGEVLVFEK